MLFSLIAIQKKKILLLDYYFLETFFQTRFKFKGRLSTCRRWILRLAMLFLLPMAVNLSNASAGSNLTSTRPVTIYFKEKFYC